MKHLSGNALLSAIWLARQVAESLIVTCSRRVFTKDGKVCQKRHEITEILALIESVGPTTRESDPLRHFSVQTRRVVSRQGERRLMDRFLPWLSGQRSAVPAGCTRNRPEGSITDNPIRKHRVR